MDRREIPSDKNAMSTKRKRLFITLEQNFGVIEQHEHAHSDSKIGMPEPTARNITKHAVEIIT
jgi:hypothetical protein